MFARLAWFALGAIIGAVAGLALGILAAMGLGWGCQWLYPNDPSAGSVGIVIIATAPGGLALGGIVGGVLGFVYGRRAETAVARGAIKIGFRIYPKTASDRCLAATQCPFWDRFSVESFPSQRSPRHNTGRNRKMKNFVDCYLSDLGTLLTRLDSGRIAQAIEWLREARDQDRTIYICGNGGSASIASQLVVDIVKGGSLRRRPASR